MPRPQSSTPQLFDTTRRSATPDRCRAAISVAGMPHRPNPPTARVAPSPMPASACSAVPTLSMALSPELGDNRSVLAARAGYRVHGLTGDHRVLDGAEAVHLHGHRVTDGQGRGYLLAGPAPELDEAAAAARAGTEDIPRSDDGAAAGVGDHLRERPGGVGQRVLADERAVDRH